MTGTTGSGGDERDLPAKNSAHGARKGPREQANAAQQQRFFLAKPGGNHGVPEFSKEFPGESEAMVESLRTGLSYFVVSEWRSVADLSGRRPQLNREAAHSVPKTG